MTQANCDLAAAKDLKLREQQEAAQTSNADNLASIQALVRQRTLSAHCHRIELRLVAED